MKGLSSQGSERNLTLIIWTLKMPVFLKLSCFQIEDKVIFFLYEIDCPTLFKMESANQSTFWKEICPKYLQITKLRREIVQLTVFILLF